VFPCPSERIATKYCLATSGNSAHLITTPHHHDCSMIDALIDEVVAEAQLNTLRSKRAFTDQTVVERLPAASFNLRTHY